MRIVCAPDSFKGSLDAADAADAMAAGIRTAIPGADIDCCPVGDGGEGTLNALRVALGGHSESITVSGKHGETVDASFANFENGDFAYVESASAIGLDPDPDKRDVMTASSYGVGELVLAACEYRTTRLLVGLGGSATNDGGCGMAQALGVRFLDASGQVIDSPISGGTLPLIAGIDTSEVAGSVANTKVIALCDVQNPLTGPNGASRVFGPQKGASEPDVAVLDAGLANLADVIKRDLGIDVDGIPGAGAAGGLGAGLVAFAGADIASGIDTVLDALGFERRVAGATLCLTGEGRIDGQSLSGKACMGVAAVAARHRVPTVALVGATGPDADQCVAAELSDIVVIGEGRPTEYSIKNVSALLSAAAARVARQYAGNGDTIDG